MFSPSTDALSMSDSSTVTSSGNGGGLHLHSANALRSPQYAEQWASQDSIQSTGGLYTPSIDSTSAAPNEYMTYPPLPSSTSNPTVDTTYHTEFYFSTIFLKTFVFSSKLSKYDTLLDTLFKKPRLWKSFHLKQTWVPESEPLREFRHILGECDPILRILFL